MDPVNPVLLVGVGGVFGAVARYLLGEYLPDAPGVHTLAVNVLGSAVLGALLAAPSSDAVLLALGTGFCGAFTTFSTFAVEAVGLSERGRHRTALAAALANLLGALAGVALGAALVGLASANF